MTDLNAMLEAERRGILPQEQQLLLNEARSRGLVSLSPLKAGLLSGEIKPTEEGAPFRVRANVGAVDRPEDKLATLQKFFPGAETEPVSGRLVFTDPKTGQAVFANPEGFDIGDLPSIAREATQAVGGTVGAAIGTAGGPAAPLTVPAGAGIGTMVAEEAFNLVARFTGTVDSRTLGERAKETGALGVLGAGGQAVGGLVGSAFRGGVRGTASKVAGGKNEIQGAVDDLARFDASPTLAQATRSPFLDSVESLVSKTPGGAGRFRKVVSETTGKIADSIEKKVEGLTGRVALDPEFVGRTVKKGLEEGFIGRFNNTADDLFGKIGIDPAKQVSVSNTAEAIGGLNLLPDVPAVNALVTSPTVRSLGGGFPDALPYEVLKRMRSAVGKRISNPSLTSDVPTGDLKQVYAAISRDMEAAAAEVGPSALKAFSRANNFYRSGLQRIEDTLQQLTNKARPEQVFAALESGAKQGPTQVRAVMKSLTSGERKVLTGGIVRRLGRATPGQQVDDGSAFSFETFLTNWNRLDKSAKNALFDWPGLHGMKADIEALARASSRVRESSRAFANPSGTAGAGVGQTAVFVGGGSALTGALTGATELLAFPAVMAMGAAGANLSARLMTSKPFVRWLAQSTRIKPNGFAGHLGRLSAVASSSEDREAILEYLNLFQGAP